LIDKQRPTKKYYSSRHYSIGYIESYEIAIDDSFEKAHEVIRQEKTGGFGFPERKDRLVACLVRCGDRFMVHQLYASELFETEIEARQDCLRRLDLLIELNRNSET
jgi:hypothetical protein